MCLRSQVLIKEYCIVPINHIFILSEINQLCCKIVLFKFLSINHSQLLLNVGILRKVKNEFQGVSASYIYNSNKN